MKNKLQKCRFSNLKSITAKVFLTFALFCSNQQLFAQLTDDFSDGDFVADPVWSGSDARFIVESGRLSLKAPADTDAAYLATTSTLINDATWEFLVQLDFNPSTSNFVRIYKTYEFMFERCFRKLFCILYTVYWLNVSMY